MNWLNYLLLWIVTREKPPKEVLLVGSRKLTQQELDYGDSLESIAVELKDSKPATSTNPFQCDTCKGFDGHFYWCPLLEGENQPAAAESKNVDTGD